MSATTQRQLSLPIDAAEETVKQRRARKITEILTDAREPSAPLDQVLSTRQVLEITGATRVERRVVSRAVHRTGLRMARTRLHSFTQQV
jgi:hypothetical protein